MSGTRDLLLESIDISTCIHKPAPECPDIKTQSTVHGFDLTFDKFWLCLVRNRLLSRYGSPAIRNTPLNVNNKYIS